MNKFEKAKQEFEEAARGAHIRYKDHDGIYTFDKWVDVDEEIDPEEIRDARFISLCGHVCRAFTRDHLDDYDGPLYKWEYAKDPNMVEIEGGYLPKAPSIVVGNEPNGPISVNIHGLFVELSEGQTLTMRGNVLSISG